ncbi:unnamed protein product [Eruca vesicaria subsp. sativa]|uniref:PGG domain-containing protein n=1 Tax=Eruca vesicaria subsp. sativa TaxID=29727 RepID=A0ABC8LFE8_ERUVS|nr:unnamed protein product [Eruca vesicaria subsp. sativa]
MSDFYKSPVTFWTYCSTAMRRLRSDTCGEARGVFLIICTLIITSTYQTALQPPGGVNQSEGNSNAGVVVMKQAFFIALFVSNTIGFCCAIFYMFCLLPLRNLFTSWFRWIGVSMCVSYALAMAVISPHPLLFLTSAFALFMVLPFFLMLEVFKRLRLSHLKAAASHPRLSWFWKD